jgi:hypothetical protein
LNGDLDNGVNFSVVLVIYKLLKCDILTSGGFSEEDRKIMFSSFGYWFERLRLVFLLGGALLLFSAQARGGEKIQITDEPDKREIPKPNDNDPFGNKPLDFLRGGGNSMSPVLPAPALNKNSLKNKTDDDNWIFGKTLDQEAALKEIFKIRDYDPEARDRKPKTAVERVFGRESDRDRKGQSRSARQKDDKFDPAEPGLDDRLKSPLTRSEEEELQASQPIAELNFKELLHPEQSAEYRSRFTLDIHGRLTHPLALSQFGNQSLSTSTSQNKQRELRLQEFERMLPGPKLLSNPLLDPIRTQEDSTRMEVNPVVGRRTEEAAMDSSSTSVNPLAGLPGQRPGSRSQVFDTFSPRSLGLSAGVSANPMPSSRAPSIMQGKPAVLELPKRAF